VLVRLLAGHRPRRRSETSKVCYRRGSIKAGRSGDGSIRELHQTRPYLRYKRNIRARILPKLTQNPRPREFFFDNGGRDRSNLTNTRDDLCRLLVRRALDSDSARNHVNASSIIRFEDLLELWQTQRPRRSIREFLGIRSRSDVRGDEENDPAFLQTLRERLDGTWWEVTWLRRPLPRGGPGGVRCRYLADTLRDAIRRCPRAQFPLQTSIDDPDDMMADDELDILPRRRRQSRPARI